jgi:plastocyanin
MPRRPAVLAALSLALALAGCGDDDAGPADGGGTPAGGGVAIGMRDIRFDPEEATVKVGQTVTWTNDEAVPHNVVAEEGADFESDTFGEGGTFSHTPEQAGTITYVCTIHPGMDGTLTVEE